MPDGIYGRGSVDVVMTPGGPVELSSPAGCGRMEPMSAFTTILRGKYLALKQMLEAAMLPPAEVSEQCAELLASPHCTDELRAQIEELQADAQRRFTTPSA